MKPIRLAKWRIHPERNLIEDGDVRRTLEPLEMHVLMRLVEARGQVVSKRQLLRDVWRDRVVVDHVVPKTVSNLRLALGDSAREARIIQTVSKRGYRLACRPEALGNRGAPQRRSSASATLSWGPALALLLFAVAWSVAPIPLGRGVPGSASGLRDEGGSNTEAHVPVARSVRRSIGQPVNQPVHLHVTVRIPVGEETR